VRVVPPMILFAQQRSFDWGDLQGVLLSVGGVILILLLLFLLHSRWKRKLLEESESALDEDEFTLDQVRQFLRDGLITQEEARVLKEKILAMSRERLAELDARRDASRRSDS